MSANTGDNGSIIRRYRVTSFDVAAEAGVSQSTVSRALAGDSVVSEVTRKRVTEAAAKLNYHVDENAARLRTGRTGTIAVVVIQREGEEIQEFNPFYLALLGAICAAASRQGHETLVSFQDGASGFFGLYEEQRKADGLIVIGTNENAAAWEYFTQVAQSGAHLVCWGAPNDALDWVRNDNESGSRLACQHLQEAGYKRIICIGSTTSPQRQFHERYVGYARFIQDIGQEPQLIAIEKGLPRAEQGRRAVKQMMDAGVEFDSIFAVCDEIALGALTALRENGLNVPGQIGVAGFDGIRAGAHVTPSLTTVEPDFQAAGEMLVGRILAVISGKTHEKSRVPVRLLARGSTCKT